MSNIESVRNFNKSLVELKCNIHSDGRPIVGLDPRKLLEIAMECDKKFMFIPAHI
jgi:PHP family Zn ribbon phosphoesterase